MADIKIINKAGTCWEIEADGERKLAVATGIPNKVFGGSDMSRLKAVPGLYFDQSTAMQEWPIQGLAEVEEQIIFWGDWIEVAPIKSPLNREELTGLTNIFSVVEKKSEVPVFSVDSFFRYGSNGLFCFPLNLMEFVHSRQSKELLMSREAYNHPDLKAKDRLSHTMAVLSFQSATGELPYTRAGGYEWIHEEMRNKKLPSLVDNGIDKGPFAEAVDLALQGESYPSLEEWKDLISNVPGLPGRMTPSFKSTMDKYEDSFVKSFNRRKNQIKITLGVIAAVFVLWVGISGIIKYMEPPYTWEMTPTEVVEAYFEGINNLDTNAIDGTTERKAGKGISNQVATMFVLSKNKEAYSQGQTISPVLWKELEYKTLPAGYTVYGVSDLVIKDLGNNEYQASYLIWYPPTEDIDNPGAYIDPHDIYAKKEIITVVRDRRDRSWVIGGFQELEAIHIPSKDILPQP